MSIFNFFKRKNKRSSKGGVVKTIKIPQAEIIRVGPATITEKMNSFNVICKFKNAYYRINSEKGHEIFRLVGRGRNHDIQPVSGISQEHNDLKSSYRFNYVKSIKEYIFTKRFFETDDKNFFVQTVFSDGEIDFDIVAKEDVQDYIDKCESKEKREIYSDKFSQYIIKGGEYTIRDGDAYELECGGKTLYNNEVVESFEVVDESRYNNLITVL